MHRGRGKGPTVLKCQRRRIANPSKAVLDSTWLMVRCVAWRKCTVSLKRRTPDSPLFYSLCSSSLPHLSVLCLVYSSLVSDTCDQLNMDQSRHNRRRGKVRWGKSKSSVGGEELVVIVARAYAIVAVINLNTGCR